MDIIDALAGAGPAVVALAAVVALIWRQLCTLQGELVKTIKEQSTATAQQAASNERMADAVDGLTAHMERQNEGDLAYRTGMKAFAQTMTTLAEGVAKRQDQTLEELRQHREATERKKVH